MEVSNAKNDDSGVQLFHSRSHSLRPTINFIIPKTALVAPTIELILSSDSLYYQDICRLRDGGADDSNSRDP